MVTVEKSPETVSRTRDDFIGSIGDICQNFFVKMVRFKV